MPNTNRFGPEATLDTLGAAVAEDGYVIIEGLLGTDEVNRLRDELQPHLDRAQCGHEEFMGSLTKRFGALIGKAPSSHGLLLHPSVLGLADRVLRPYCASYYVNYTGVMHLEPGEKAQVLHRDTNIYPFTNPSPPFTLATMWAVTDFTRDNGGTMIVPGSNHWEDERTPEPHEILCTEMPAGSVLIYSGNTIHGAGANRANSARLGVALHYTLGWLRQEENQFLTLPLDEARKLPEPVQRLMGYSLGATHLGFVDHVDPHEFLNQTQAHGPSDLAPLGLTEAESTVHRLSVVSQSPAERPRYAVEPDSSTA